MRKPKKQMRTLSIWKTEFRSGYEAKATERQTK